MRFAVFATIKDGTGRTRRDSEPEFAAYLGDQARHPGVIPASRRADARRRRGDRSTR